MVLVPVPELRVDGVVLDALTRSDHESNARRWVRVAASQCLVVGKLRSVAY